MNIDTAMFFRQEKIRRFPNSVLAKQDRFLNDSKKKNILFGLREETNWNEFANSLVIQFNKFGSLSEGQLAAAEKFLAKLEATRYPLTVEVEVA